MKDVIKELKKASSLTALELEIISLNEQLHKINALILDVFSELDIDFPKSEERCRRESSGRIDELVVRVEGMSEFVKTMQSRLQLLLTEEFLDDKKPKEGGK